jgi:exodeoxyribonuclease VII large subunit
MSMLPFQADERADPPVLTVSEFTAQIKDTLEQEFPAVWVSGEISNLARPRSGHVYLTLKDEDAQLRAVMWRTAVAEIPFDLEDGLEVVCFGGIDVYAPRGSYQLVIRQIEPKGIGSLQLALKQLQAKLAAEGLFAPEHKRPLPRFPRRVAFVTSPTGAAIRDFLEVVGRRWRQVDVLVIPARVQGEGAAEEIADGVRTANRLANRPDVIVVGRGGGSLEDLWCFNEEPVVRSIFASDIPVVSAVGHEIDVTLSDLVADRRALTPSEAAELVVPSRDELIVQLDGIRRRVAAALKARVTHARSRIDALADARVFRRPLDRVHDLTRQVDELQMRLVRAVQQCCVRSRECLSGLSGRLESLSPLSVLRRGYSLTHRTDDGRLVLNAKDTTVGDRITTRLAHGSVVSRIEQVSEVVDGLN